jgi:SAM-dependent methyltransferase
MSSWSEGYIADIPYSLGFYRETVPAHIAFASASVGKHPGLVLRPRRVLELGIGMGLGFVINAASNPATYFEGVDFNPLHIAHARGLADSADINNLNLREASFQDLAREAQEGQHDLDLIVLHGILTWVSADAHEAIVDIARKRLKPGGMLYVSYNCMPGWAPILPMQRLMRENAKPIAGRSDVQTGAGLDLLQALMAEGAMYFAANPTLKARVEKLLTMDRNYLSHEYLNANWFIFHFADVAEMFSRAKLDFVSSATLAENMDGVAIPEGVRARIAAETDPVHKETLRDIGSNKQFRRDIFGRGIAATTPAEQSELLTKQRFSLIVPRSKVTFKISGPLGELDGNAELYGAATDRLANGPASLEEIAVLPEFNTVGAGGALQALTLLVHSGQVMPLPTEEQIDHEPAKRLNKVLSYKISQGRAYGFLAAPAAGSGLPASNVEMLMLDSFLSGNDNIDALAKQLGARMKALGINWLSEGKPVAENDAIEARTQLECTAFLDEKLPLWRQLGVL